MDKITGKHEIEFLRNAESSFYECIQSVETARNEQPRQSGSAECTATHNSLQKQKLDFLKNENHRKTNSFYVFDLVSLCFPPSPALRRVVLRTQQPSEHLARSPCTCGKNNIIFILRCIKFLFLYAVKRDSAFSPRPSHLRHLEPPNYYYRIEVK